MENAVAKCYFNKPNNDQNLSYFTPHWLFVVRRKKSWRFSNENISQIEFSAHKLLIPLILGGIATSFAFLMIFRNLFDPFTSLMLLLAGLIAIYYGWTGSHVLIVHEGKTDTKIYIPAISNNLREYFNFYNSYRLNQQEMIIYHIATKEDWNLPGDNYSHSSLSSEGFIHASKKQQTIDSFDLYFPTSGEFFLLEIDTLKVEVEIKYEHSEGRNEAFPHIFGAFNKSSIVASHSFKNKEELSAILKN